MRSKEGKSDPQLTKSQNQKVNYHAVKQNSQKLNNDTFCRLPVISTQGVTSTEKFPDSDILLNYDDDDDYSQGYAQFKNVFGAVTKDNILQPFRCDEDFRSFNAGVVEVGFNLYVFVIRYQQNFTASQPIKVKFKFEGVVPNNIIGYALVLTNKIVSKSSDGQRHFELF